jgi:hypothetical protein
MDSQRFDALARALTPTPTRRRLSQAVTGLALSGALASACDRRSANAGKRKQSCAQRCPEACPYCLTRADAPPLCAGGFVVDCDVRVCSSDNPCVGTTWPYCVTRAASRGVGDLGKVCPDGKGHCARPDPCG